MKTIILYDSIKGYTKKCAEYLHSNIEGSDIFDIDNRVFDLGDYDQVLIGAPIYVGEIEETMKEFIKRFKIVLLKKKLGIFCSGMNPSEFSLAVQSSLPPNIFYHAEIVNCGGIIDYPRLSFREKYTIWRRLKIRESLIDEHLEELDVFFK